MKKTGGRQKQQRCEPAVDGATAACRLTVCTVNCLSNKKPAMKLVGALQLKCINYIFCRCVQHKQLKKYASCSNFSVLLCAVANCHFSRTLAVRNLALLAISQFVAQRRCCMWNRQQLQRAQQKFCRTSRPWADPQASEGDRIFLGPSTDCVYTTPNPFPTL